MRRTIPILLLAVLACSDGTGTASRLPLKDVSDLAAQLDTIEAGFRSPQLKSLSALALPMLAARLDIQHMDSSVLGKTVEWDAISRRVFLTTRPGTPGNLLRVTLYQLDRTGLPASPKVEIGYALKYFFGGLTIESALFASGFWSLEAAARIPREPGVVYLPERFFIAKYFRWFWSANATSA